MRETKEKGAAMIDRGIDQVVDEDRSSVFSQ